MRHLIAYFIIAGITTSCGKDDTSDATVAGTSDPNSTSAKNDGKNFILRGSVTSTFAVTVDGAEYLDLEDYFTQERARLPDKVAAAGYEGYAVRFDAAIGFRDLAVGMYVYLQVADKRGYQSQTVVAKDGTFAFSLPGDAAGDTYKFRANKRVAVYLTKATESKKFCYNFSAIDLDVPYTEKDKPIVLSTFKTALTAYECTQDKGAESQEIPATSDNPVEIKKSEVVNAPKIHEFLRGAIAPGADDNVIYMRTADNLAAGIIRGYECIATKKGGEMKYYTYKSGICESDAGAEKYLGMDCHIVTAAGKIVTQENIRTEYLEPGASWPTMDEICPEANVSRPTASPDSGTASKGTTSSSPVAIPPILEQYRNGLGLGDLHGLYSNVDRRGASSDQLCADYPGGPKAQLLYYTYAAGICERQIDGHNDCFMAIGYQCKQPGPCVKYQEGIRPEYLKAAASWPTKDEVCTSQVITE